MITHRHKNGQRPAIDVFISPLHEKKLHHLDVRANANEMDRVSAGAIGIIDVRAIFQEHFDDFDLPPKTALASGVFPVGGRVSALDVGPFLEEFLDRPGLPKGSGLDQGLVQLRFLGRRPCRPFFS